ncbi:MAG TPA: hypothetical protein VFB58_15245 [Chloroflexota bacterium]|nr:hypothetical protein [Chloroflexota bacterium]
MYISSQALQAMHQEIVNEGLRRAEQRRLLSEVKARESQTRHPSPLRRLLGHVLRGLPAQS